ncbi:MAG TPA: PEP-CTERM sorting domain-containing protein [Chthoniobacterales bacterium]|nr:PEP-CTERM sorting domain-containing protein [Chthoniobacterales bacterium]
MPGDYTATFATDASVSGDLTIVLRNTGGAVDFDNVCLSAAPTVPEPLTLSLVGLGPAIGFLKGRQAK